MYETRVVGIDYLAGRVSGQAALRLLSSGITADATQTFEVEGNPPKILQVSPEAFPHVVRDAAQKAEAARAALGDALGWAVLAPLEQWETNGISCAFYERLRPISANRIGAFLQKRRITPLVIEWLHRIAAIDRGHNNQAETCLTALANCPCAPLRIAADGALDRLNRGLFAPRFRVMHTDFWIGNILLDPSGLRDFVVIDWRGSQVDGYPVFDLIRFADSVRLGPDMLRSELQKHAQVLGCELEDSRSYLLAALGHIWMNLDQFPAERFASMGERSLNVLDRAIHG